MKPLLTICLITATLTTTAQRIETIYKDTSKVPFFKVLVMGHHSETKEVAPVLSLDYKDKLIVLDSLVAIQGLIEQLQKAEKRKSRDYAAHEVLRWIDTSGKVVNRKLFNNAVKNYMQLKEWE